ncbi:hypothetical protein EMPS_02425 [Entomortierella parvispora]|uniref:Uncharacterized protein n=1 Tax=Entomortierella parvispora TaxID=205924 RepID=A0A9P3LTG7_9FUNG|nr:hypothetical protein EMPS_02425 [Entomortierella parvispora]
MSPYPPFPPSMAYLQEQALCSLQNDETAELKRSPALPLETTRRKEHFPKRVVYPGKERLTIITIGYDRSYHTIVDTRNSFSFLPIDPSTLDLLCYSLLMYAMDMTFLVFWGCVCLTVRRRQAQLEKTNAVQTNPSESFLARILILDVFGRSFALSLNFFSWKEHVLASTFTAMFAIYMKLPTAASACSTVAWTVLVSYFLVIALRRILAVTTKPLRLPSSPSRRSSPSHDRATSKMQSCPSSTVTFPSVLQVAGFAFAACVIIPWVYGYTGQFGLKAHPVPVPDVFLQNGIPYTISKVPETRAYPEDEGPLPTNPGFLVKLSVLLVTVTLWPILSRNPRHRLRSSSSRRAGVAHLRTPDGWFGQLFLVAACAVWAILPRWAALLSFLVVGYFVPTHRSMATLLKQVPILPWLKGFLARALPSHPDMRTRLEILVYNLVLCPIINRMIHYYTPAAKRPPSSALRSRWMARITALARLYNCPQTPSRFPKTFPLASSLIKKEVSPASGNDCQILTLNPEPPSPEQRKGRRRNRELTRISTATDISSWTATGQDKLTKI